jgi:hypothetical protein
VGSVQSEAGGGQTQECGSAEAGVIAAGNPARVAEDSAGRRSVQGQEEGGGEEMCLTGGAEEVDGVRETAGGCNVVHHQLPKYPVTARCVRKGTVCFAYVRDKSVTNAALFLVHLYRHLSSYGISLEGLVVRTDNGTESTNLWNSTKVTVFT